jgi:hypothetical protein
MSHLPEPDPVSADRRRARRQVKLPQGAACVICGVTDHDILVVGRSIIEAEHPLGEEAAPDVWVPLCRNHHAAQTAAQHDHQALPPPGPRGRHLTVPETLERVLRALAVFAHALAHALVGFADQVRDLVAGLDQEYPNWRDQPWAR